MEAAMTMEEFVVKCQEDIVFFAENMIRSEDGGFYTLEEHQRAMVTSEESQVVYFCGRRLGKSFMLLSIFKNSFFVDSFPKSSSVPKSIFGST